MVRYAPLKVGYYFGTHIWPWFAALGLIMMWVGIDFTDAKDWGDAPDSNGHWSALPIVCLCSYFGSVIGMMGGIVVDCDDYHWRDYQRMVRDSRFNDRNEKILAQPTGDRVNIYKKTSGLSGKQKKLLASFDVSEDLEATDKAIQFATEKKAELEQGKESEKYVNPEAKSLARVINKA